MTKSVKRLYQGFQPENYALEITPDKHKLIFKGNVTITGRKTGRPSHRFTFHQKGLRILSASIIQHSKQGDTEITVDRINTHGSFDELRLHTKDMLYPGKYTVRLEFNGKITPAMSGIYPSYFHHKNKKHTIITTQFESHYAREAFPCIDEPEAKATFDLTIASYPTETVLSNTPILKQKKLKEVTMTTFETTPIMSTYLLAFVIGELQSVETQTKGGVLVRSWASITQPKDHLQYATKEAADILDYFTDYFGIPFPLKKLDQVALPDFDSAAMENWGLVTFREVILLADPKNRSISNEQLITLVIAHELSHQWFGNLVTMKWWDDLWLNESFAGLMEHVAPAALHPDWQQWENYAISDIPLITSRDTYKDIQSVGIAVTDPDLIPTLFDPAIVYAKGARLLKMLREYIGDQVFVEGLQAYFKQHAYGNATRDDLWSALGKASGKDISALMTPWLTQPGMPIIHVVQTKQKLSIAQERFMLDSKPDGSIWPIPLFVNNTLEPNLISDKSASITLHTNDFVLMNPYASGQYITHYVTPEHRKFVAEAIENTDLSTEARVNTFNDLYMLARHGESSLSEALDIVVRNTHESRDSVWGMMLRLLGAANQLTEGDAAAESQLKQVRVFLATDWYQKLGWDDKTKDDSNTKQLRHTMVALMIGGEDTKAITEALKRYEISKHNLQAIPAELRNTVLAAAVKHGEPSIVKALLISYTAASPEVQLDIASALASTKDPEVARYIIGKALGKKGFVRDQDVMRWLASFLSNHHVRSIAWEFMRDNWEWVEETLSNSKSFDYLPTYAASMINSEEWAKKYRKLFEPKINNKLLTRNINIGLADIEARLAWRNRDEPAIKSWLTKQLKARSKS